MRSIRVTFSDGNSLVTSINGTDREIIEYYLRRTFNVGRSEDAMATCVKVEFLDN
jgi:hypothetical protein